MIEQLTKQILGEVDDTHAEKWIELFDDDKNGLIDVNGETASDHRLL